MDPIPSNSRQTQHRSDPLPSTPRQTVTPRHNPAPPPPARSNRVPVFIAMVIVFIGMIYTILNTVSFEPLFDVAVTSVSNAPNSEKSVPTQIPQRPTRIPPTRTSPRVAQAQATFSGVINTGRLNVRSGPSINDYITFRVSQGDIVEILGRNNSATWLVIDSGVVGWVNAEYIRTSGNLSSLHVYNSNELLPSSSRQIRFSCPNTRGPSFQINHRFVVPFGKGPTTIWSGPNQEPRVTRVPEGQGGVILGGPICTEGQEGNLIFWYVRSDNGFEGYMGEGYLSNSIPWIEPVN